MPFVMRSVKIWGGGMLGLVGGFLVGHLLLQMFVSSDDARVTSETAVSVLLALTVPLILGTVLGAYVAARLTRPAPYVGSPLRARFGRWETVWTGRRIRGLDRDGTAAGWSGS